MTQAAAVRFLLLALLVWCSAGRSRAATAMIEFDAQAPAAPAVYDAPTTSSCGLSYTPLRAALVLPDDGVTSATGVLLNLPGFSHQANCELAPTALLDWHNSRNLIVATVGYRNLAYLFPTDFGKLSIGDTLRALAEILRRYPEVDTRRLYLFGGSGGGHLTLQLLQATPDFWAEVHIHSAITLISTTDDVMLRGYKTNWNGNLGFPVVQGGLPWDKWERYQAERELRSPQFHAAHAPPVSCPVRIFHGSADTLVPIVNMVDFREKLRPRLGDPITVGPDQVRMGNHDFFTIVGGDHGYAGAAPDRNSRVLASRNLVPDCFTRRREEAPSLAVDFTSAPSHGYVLRVAGADLRTVTVAIEPAPTSIPDALAP